MQILSIHISSVVADLLIFDCGCNISWTPPATATLRSTDLNVNPLEARVTPLQESWITASVNLRRHFWKKENTDHDNYIQDNILCFAYIWTELVLVLRS